MFVYKKTIILDLPIQLDLLIVVDRSTTINEVRQKLEEQLAQQLDLLENSINKQINVSYSSLFFFFFLPYKSVAKSTIKTIKSMTKRIINIIQHQHGHRQPLYARQQTISSSLGLFFV